jgi:hypothetical protein
MRARLGAVVMLRVRGGERLEIHRLTPDEALIQEILEMNFFEARYFRSLTRRYLGEQQAESEMRIWREQERQVLIELFRHAPVYRLRIPVGFGEDTGSARELLSELSAIAADNGRPAGRSVHA